MRTACCLLIAAAALAASAPARAGGDVSCRLSFEMKGWSAIYKTMTGHGTVSCNNGASMHVMLESKGLGLTAGKSSIDEGKGVISGVKSIDEVLGSYVAADATGAVVKAGSASVLTKGEVSLALSGKGRGFEAGISLSDFTIKR